MDERKISRLSGDIQRILEEVIIQDVSDERLQNVLITRVKLARDGSHATVFFETTGSETDSEDACAAMKSAAGFLRSKLADGIRMRTVPVLSFVHDSSGKDGDRVLGIMRNLDTD
ncbi:MAG: 30S ribosome-binding factor RbfA [Candidatus Fermentibacteraceae bacterium]|nr:30S ribosome-binding factor RbfA [Candidatus Fermentibacteraceae bacterium]